MHVLPQPDAFQAWLHGTLERLLQVTPLVPVDPVDDLFDRRIGEQLGPLVGRPTFDMAVPVEASQDRRFLAACFA